MIRDNRRINIETDFFGDEDYCMLQEDTLESNLMSRDRGTIAFYNVIDTIRLHRLISSFNLLQENSRIRLRKYSSRELHIPNRFMLRNSSNNLEVNEPPKYDEEDV